MSLKDFFTNIFSKKEKEEADELEQRSSCETKADDFEEIRSDNSSNYVLNDTDGNDEKSDQQKDNQNGSDDENAPLDNEEAVNNAFKDDSKQKGSNKEGDEHEDSEKLVDEIDQQEEQNKKQVAENNDEEKKWQERSWSQEVVDNEADEAATLKQEQVSEEKHVQFINVEAYKDLSRLSDMIERHKHKVGNEALLSRLSLIEDSADFSTLDEYKRDYALKHIQSSDIQDITQTFVDNLDSLIETTQLNLVTKHDEVLTTNYELRALDAIEFELDDLQDNKDQAISQYKEKQNSRYDKKIETFKKKQEKELEAFKRKQETKFLETKEELINRRDNNIELYEKEKEKEYNRKYKAKLNKQRYTEEQLGAKELNPIKQDVLQEFQSELKEASNKVQEKLKPKLNEIREGINQKEHDWIQEITEQKRLSEERKKRRIEEERLALQKEEFELERKERLEKLEMAKEAQRLQALERSDDHQKEIERLQRELEKHEKSTAQMNEVLLAKLINQLDGEQEADKDLKSDDSIKKPEVKPDNYYRKFYWIVSLIVLILVGLALWFFVLNDSRLPSSKSSNVSDVAVVETAKQAGEEAEHDESDYIRRGSDDNVITDEHEDIEDKADDIPSAEVESEEETAEQATREELKEKVQILEKELERWTSVDNMNGEPISFDEALERGDFQAAIKTIDLDDDESFNRLTDEMRRQGELEVLQVFNERYDTTYGLMDQHYLSDNIWGVWNEMMWLTNDERVHMGDHRKQDVANYLWDNHFYYYSRWLINAH
ncbi:hypothetical protein [Dolosigranulum pigrum]|uniref:hypothetical protein n=1 Tax=Dolosigranulum pigrum TaxID=29394 RepID=UPI001AD857E6|nr:hypothetical protein [Dolosigranulum pigrum]QTJ37725.1 hypothetical protein FE324_02660 [Dolosigranulum pigrum]QTJ45616.1 hypothetical protein FE328_08785 [Dolosigranulum pigrum]